MREYVVIDVIGFWWWVASTTFMFDTLIAGLLSAHLNRSMAGFGCIGVYLLHQLAHVFQAELNSAVASQNG